MTRPGIKSIDICYETSGTGSGSSQQDRLIVVHHTYVNLFDQQDASFSEELKDDEEGLYFKQNLAFTVREETAMNGVLQNIRRPVYVLVYFIDGTSIQMGSTAQPVWLETKKNNNGSPVKEVQVSVENETIESVFA